MLRSGSGGGLEECNEVDEILKDTLAGEYTSERCSSTNEVGIWTTFVPALSRIWLRTFGLEFGGNS